MKRIGMALSCGLILVALAGCPSASPGVDPEPVVYVAGYYYDGTYNRAAYWKDDGNTITREILDDLAFSSNSEASDIFVDANGVVYVSGNYNDNSAVYWTDDGTAVTRHVLHDSSDAQATGIFVEADGTVYVSGYYYDSVTDVAVYWVDDGLAAATPRDLHYTSDSVATDIHVDAVGNVYSSGYRTQVFPIAVYWIYDGADITETDLHTDFSDANAIFVEGSAVFIAGRYAPTGPLLAALWTASTWSGLSPTTGNAWDLVRYGGQTYSAGNYLSGTVQKAAYWTGITETGLTGNLSNTFAFGIYVYEGDVYAAGVQNDTNSSSGAGTEAVYWRNGDLTDLSAGGGSRGNAIFVR